MEPRLRRQLERVDERLAQVRREGAASLAWLALAVCVGVAFLRRLDWSLAEAGLGLAVAAVVVLGVRALVGRRRREPLALARLVERERGELDSSLLAAAELEPDLPDGRYGYLATRLVDQVLVDARREEWPERVVPRRRIALARGVHAAAALAFATLALTTAGPARTGASTPAGASLAEAAPGLRVAIEPGDVEIERGRGLLVTATFAGGAAPAGAELVAERVSGAAAEVARVRMSRSLDDPVFAARLAAVDRDLEYRVEWPGGASPTYRVTVFERPAFDRADVLLSFPPYAGLEDRRLEDTRRVTAPVGTVLTFFLTLNKPVATARLVERDGGELRVDLVASVTDPRVVEGRLDLLRSARLELELVDADGREAASRPTFVLNATDNARPEVTLAGAGDRIVSPIEELDLDAKVTDDFGLVRFGLEYRLAGAEATEVVLGADVRGEAEGTHVVPFEDLGAEAGQLLTYHFWAEDLGLDGAVRRTRSDLFLAEVRPFEQVFREAENSAGGESQPSPQGDQPQGQEGAAQLVELQKQVLLATWNALRNHGDGADTLGSDAGVVRDAQRDAREQLGALGDASEMLGVDDADGTIEKVGAAMDAALEDLERATPEGLDDALADEQAALQGLLELQARELDVARASQQQQGQQQQGGSRANAQAGVSQQQLDQLELSNRENRYENQRQAGETSLQEAAARDTRRALDALQELARRQEDLNERVRELQSELELAQTEQEREELRRRLERLQESQEEILRDTDELQQEMEESSASSQLAEQREQLEQTRENVRRASEALEEERLAEALTEGARAERSLEELEQELRDAAGGQFDQRARDLVREARRLEQEQERLADELEELTEATQRSLRGDEQREEIGRALEQQTEDLEELLDDVEETVLEAETTEPLLAEELYDALDRARRAEVEESLDSARELLEQGFPREAEDEQEGAREGLAELRQGVERAAESVLGSGAEALERAQEELDRLAQELESEVARGRGQGAEGEPDEEPGEQGEGGEPGEGQPGERVAQGEQPGEGQPGQEPTGEGQPGDGQPGERRSLSGVDPDRPESGGGRGGAGGRYAEAAPLTGENFRDWSDRLRDVEDMLDDPELAAEAARLRSRARATREEAQRHAEEPDWELVDEKILTPLSELRQRVAAELRRRRAEDDDVPIDRDPVPPEFDEAVRRYYERLGRGK